jgi:hypothetical protein
MRARRMCLFGRARSTTTFDFGRGHGSSGPHRTTTYFSVDPRIFPISVPSRRRCGLIKRSPDPSWRRSGGGYRWFTFKPDDAYSFTAPTAFVAIRHLARRSASQVARIGNGARAAAWRGAASWVRLARSSGCSDIAGVSPPRSILDRTRGMEPDWKLAIRVGGALHINQSNSYGRVACARPRARSRRDPSALGLSLSVRGEVVVTHYADPLTVPSARRGTAKRQHRRRKPQHLSARHRPPLPGVSRSAPATSIYTSAPASNAVDYRRQTLLFYFAFLDDRW